MPPSEATGPRRTCALLAAALGIGLLASLPAPSAQAAAPDAAVVDPITAFDAVDQFIGTELDTSQNKSNDAYGNTYPGAALPFGMVQPSPTTYKVGETNDLVREKGGYEYTANQIRGFGMTRYSGTGCHTRFGGYEFPTIPYGGSLSAEGGLPVSPDANLNSYFLDFKHANEVSEPGYYAVTTDNGVATELTATRRTAVSRFDFPATGGSTLVLDASGANNRVFAADVTIDAATRTVSGSMYGTDVCDNGNFYRAYFSTTYDQPFASYGTWNGADVKPGSTTDQKGGTDTGADLRHDVGAWLTFAPDTTVTAKTGFSYTDVTSAAANAEAETATSSFDDVRADAKATWEEALSTVDVTGGTDAERTKLYTALYHSLLQPTIGQDADGRYLGYDGQLYQVEAGHDFFRRINFAGQGWDMYRSQAQLIAMLFPKVATDINRSIVALTQEAGKWSPGAARMSGDNYQVILSTLDAFGATDYDRQAALDSMKTTQLLPATSTTRSEGFQYAAAGFIENRKGDSATSRVLEYAIDDFAIAQLAERLGDDTAYETFMTRAQSWQNVFDPTTQHIRPRERTGFDRGFDLRNRDQATNGGQFNQSTGYQYGWMVPHNIGEMVERRGGVQASMRAVDVLMERLDAGAYTQTGNYLSNEAAFTTPWVYNWLQAPHKATDVLRRAVTEMYKTTPNGLPGNDDEGALSAWYVFANLGIAPMIHGTANLLVTAPMFDHVTLSSLGSDRVYEIDAPGVSTGAHYTTGLSVDGVPQTASWVGEDFARSGGTLDFTMAATPGTWGTGAADVPPSYSTGIDARNNIGTSPDGVARMGSMDLSDWSFSRETLATKGATPGAAIPFGSTGITFTWPDTEPGEPDNWISNGQRIDLPNQQAGSISFMGLATNGPSTSTARVEYTDGSTQAVPVTLNDWTGSGNGNTELFSMGTRNNANGTSGTGTFKVFATRPAPLDRSKTVGAVVLPPASYSGVMHVFDVATSEQENVDPNAPTGTPERIVLTATVDPSTSQYVTWRSRSPLTLEGHVELRVPGATEVTASDAVQMPERTVDGYPSRSHSAKLENLSPDTTYEYRVASGTQWSDWAQFRTAEAADEPFQFLYFGDAQEGIDTVWPGTLQAAHTAVPDARLSLFAGDLIDSATDETQWRNWFDAVGTYGKGRTSQMLAAMGNHEIGGDALAPAFRDSFEYDPNGPLPSDAGVYAATYGEHMASVMKDSVYFSDYQGVRFVTMNANRDDICPLIQPPGLATFNCDEGRRVWMSMQASWLDRVLEENPNKWAVMLTHQPIFSVSEGRNEDNWRRYVGPVLEKHDIDLVLQGHDHTYGRGFHNLNATSRTGVSTGPVYVVANAGQKQYALQGQPNVWTNNNATLMKSFADTSTYQAISVDGDRLTYKSVATWARAGGQSPFQPGDTVDEFTITKYDDGAKWVTEPGVAVPGDDVPAEGRTRPSTEPFDDDTFGDVVWDDDFSTDKLAQYATRAGNEALPTLSVDTAAGVLKATATSRSWGNIVPPVKGGERWALIVEPKSFAGTRANEDSMFVGASADNQNMWMNWYNNTRKETGYDFAASTGGRTVGRDSTGLSVDPGDRVAFVVDHGEVSSWIEENDTWRRYNVGLAGYALQPGVLESWKPTLGLRLDPGTIAIDRLTVLAGLPSPVTPTAVTFADQPGVRNDTYTVPTSQGVEYVVGDAVVAAGTYPGSGTVTVTARASGDAPIADGAPATWTHTFTTDAVTPAAVTFTDQYGTKQDTYTVPVSAGVEFVVAGDVVAAGTYPGSGTVTVTARASGDAPIANGVATSWSRTFATDRASLAITLTGTGGRYGTASTVTGTLLSASGPVSGPVSIAVDGQAHGTATAAAGGFSVELDRALPAGTHQVTVEYAGDDDVDVATGMVEVTVARATPKVTLKVTPKKAKAKRTRLTAVVKVSLPGSTVGVTGKVKVKVGGKTLSAKVRDGRARVKLPAIAKPGSIKVKATYVASESIGGGSAKPVAITVTR